MSWNRRIARRLLRDQRGQDTVEYIGVLAIVAALIGVVLVAVGPLGPTIEHGAECLIAKVFHLNTCTAGPAYPVSASSKNVGYDGRVAIVNGGHSYTITLTKLSNGTSTITVVDNGKVGVSAQWGADVELGPLGGAGADATIGGGVYGAQTNTWKFPSWSAGQNYYNKISQGSSLGLGAHDVVAGTVGSLPGGSLATGLFDKVTGSSGAPDQGSLPHQYLNSSTTGGGLQGNGDAGAHVNFGPLQGAVGVSAEANAGLQRVTYGSGKGDWQLVAGLDASGDGTLANWLFGAQADVAGNVSGDVTVTFSPSGTPQTLEVTASGDGVWGVGPSAYAGASVPGKEGQGAKPGESGGAGGKEPVLSLETNTSSGSGEGSQFTGELDLSNNPQATQDVTSILEGNSAPLGDLINQMNTSGTETIQTYHITRSNSKVGAGLSVGAGVAANLSDGSSNATYNPPKTREDGGKWHTGS